MATATLAEQPELVANDVTRVASPEDPEKKPGSDLEAHTGDDGYLSGVRLFLVFIGMLLTVFLFALDQSIVATAIPVIVSDFHSFTKVSWIITAYFLTQCSLILLVGQSLRSLKAKYVLLGSLFFFELGSLICAVSKSMDVLIFGRAIQGIGCSGMFTCSMQIITVITRVQQRPTFMAGLGFAFMISSVIGPLLGGVFTQHVTWRWCFYINLPFGGIAAASIVFLLPAREPVEDESTKHLSLWQRLARLDYLGSGLILAIVTCLLLALQWAGNEYAWSNWRIILLFILGGAIIGLFIGWNLLLEKKYHRALVPLTIMHNRTLVLGSLSLAFTMFAFLGCIYQVPLYYQAVRHHSPTKAGIDQLPFMISSVIALAVSGGVAQSTGRYWYSLIIGPILAAPGLGLLYSVTAETSSAKLIGYQIIAGVGLGCYFQNLLLAVQAEFADKIMWMPNAVGFQTFSQLAGAALGIGILNSVQSVFLNRELHRLAPDAPFELVRQSVSAIYTLPEAMQPPVIEAYVIAISRSYIPGIAAVCLALLCNIFIANHDLKTRGLEGTAIAA
ncbi:major facilitator superfamily-domain-containing protein [Kockovaella imperatae]|uniref:Major facilitator superfamily-domain-containing protein n=1 Tax=Kockovaella imperatae TaxID=4999 RepID=A0A1Y1U786_9TREE|nr:major facilitator superfamily-domain-containing protein [Kockovaella imperatae]ORX33889.1 major facilitator superfamily-domain-containing protein [Kockovaella imperatae]